MRKHFFNVFIWEGGREKTCSLSISTWNALLARIGQLETGAGNSIQDSHVSAMASQDWRQQEAGVGSWRWASKPALGTRTLAATLNATLKTLSSKTSFQTCKWIRSVHSAHLQTSYLERSGWCGRRWSFRKFSLWLTQSRGAILWIMLPTASLQPRAVISHPNTLVK